ncbi:MAG: histidine kinase [Flavobacteriaceae bacterium]|nr:MAG: histidine kinase [Flavobacteriaceae bacterium]
MIGFKNTSAVIPRKYHVLFWTVYFLFNVVRWGSYFDDYWYSLKSNLVEFPLHIWVVYVNIYWLIPYLIVKRKFRSYMLALASLLGIVYVVRTGLNYVLVTQNIWPEAEGVQEAFTFNHIVAVVLGELYVITLATAIKLTYDWVFELNRSKDLKKRQLQMELDLLKSQIQPHFFFNTLNNLYALTLTKSDVAPSVVLKLSDIMQYVLYEVKEPKINLYDEVKYVQNYLDLERLRYGDRIETSIEIKGSIEDLTVPPLLFLPFIENCFKHGVYGDNPMKVKIGFDNKDDGFLYFSVENSCEDIPRETQNKGIGIQNVSRRLELLFKEDFELTSGIIDAKYCVFLKLPV